MPEAAGGVVRPRRADAMVVWPYVVGPTSVRACPMRHLRTPSVMRGERTCWRIVQLETCLARAVMSSVIVVVAITVTRLSATAIAATATVTAATATAATATATVSSFKQ